MRSTSWVTLLLLACTDGGMSTEDAGDETRSDEDSDTEDASDTEDTENSTEASFYAGIPYPTDALPGNIMPDLPEPGVQAGWPYDPLTLELPEPSGGDHEYYVSVSGDDDTAGNDGQGTQAAPRATMPAGPFSSGTVVFIEGADTTGGVDFDIGEDDEWVFDCEADAPCFVVGLSRPRIGARMTLTDSSHVVVEGLHFVEADSGNRPFGRFDIYDSSYITTRDIEISGDGSNSSGGGNAMYIDGVEFLVSSELSIHDIGSWESNDSGKDVHGWRPGYDNRYLWLLDSELYHLQADGVQTGNSSNDQEQSASSHYIFIAGNTFYENYENALDNKNSYHVIFADNDVHGFQAASDGSGANATAIILSNNSEGPWTGYHWALRNRIWDVGLAIRDSGSEDDEKNFAIGNIIWDAETSFVQANNAEGRECWVIDNTAYTADLHFDIYQPGVDATAIVRGNVFYGGEVDTMSDTTSILSDNVLYGTTIDGAWDEESHNLDVDPELVDPANGDMTPTAKSPVIDARSEEDEVYDLFKSLYGLDIRVDGNGTSRPAGAGWDLGAIELPY